MRFEEVDSGDKVVALDRHHHIDGIQAGLAVEATGEVGPRIDGGEDLAAARTEEAEPPFAALVGPVELWHREG